MANVDPRRSIEMLQPAVAKLSDRIQALTPQEWEHPSNCAGWRVADLAAHVVRNGESVLLAVQRALTGDQTPAFGASVAHRQEEILAAGPVAAAEQQRRQTAELTAIVNGLTPERMQKTFPHPAGPRTVAWFCTQRLVEVAFHAWDLEWSLGSKEPMDPTTATYLLPFMLDPAVPSTFGRNREGAQPQSFLLKAGGSTWTLHHSAEGLKVSEGGQGAADITIQAKPEWVALALYGRIRIDQPNFEVSGPSNAADRFAGVFGQPPA